MGFNEISKRPLNEKTLIEDTDNLIKLLQDYVSFIKTRRPLDAIEHPTKNDIDYLEKERQRYSEWIEDYHDARFAVERHFTHYSSLAGKELDKAKSKYYDEEE